MKWVSYTRSISSRIGEENPSNTIAEQNERIAQYLKKRGCSISEKYSDRKRTAEAAEGFDRLVQDGMARKFDAVVVDSIFRCGRTLPFAIEALQRTFYPLGIQFAVVEDDFCSADKTAEEVAEYFNGKTIDKIRSEFITNRQNHFEEGTLTHRQARYGYALSEDRRNLVLNPESAQVVKLIFQMYLEDMKIPEIARALEAQGVPSPQIQMAKKKRSRTKIKWPDSTIRSILKNPLYIGKCTLTLAKAKRELEVPAIVSKTEFQKAQKKLESTRLPSRKKARKKPNLLFKKIYDKESRKGLLCRTSEDESRQIYSFDKGYRCFSGKAPFIESEKIFREILSALEKEKMQAAHIDRVLDLNPEKVKQCMDAGLLQYRKKANEIVARLMAKDDERTAVYREYEQESISLEQVEEYEHQYQVAVQKQEAAFKKVMLAVNDAHEAIILKSDFEKVQARREQNKEKRERAMARSKATREKCYNHLSGMVYCGCCRRNMTFERRVHGTVKETHYGVFICKRKKNTTPCAYHAVPEKMLMMVAMDQIHHLVSTMCEEEKLVKDMMRGSNLDSARSIKMKENSILFRIQEAEERRLRLYEDYKAEILDEDEYSQLKEHYIAEKQRLEHELQKQRQRALELEKRIKICDAQMERMRGILNQNEFDEELVHELIKRIYVGMDNSVEVEFKCSDPYQEVLAIMSEVQNE